MKINQVKKFPDKIHSITYQDVVGFFDANGVDVSCCVCGSDISLFPGVRFDISDDDEKPVPSPDTEKPAIKSMLLLRSEEYGARFTVPVVTGSCEKCGYIMHFLAERIADWKYKNGHNSS